MHVILHLSDSHFGKERDHVIDALIELSSELRPDIALFTGDVTQRARARQFDTASRFLKSLKVEHVITIPGNHDIPLFNLYERFFNPYGNFKKTFGNTIEPVYETDWVKVIGVNTTRHFRHKHGEISDSQIENVKNLLLSGNIDQLKIIMVHHPMEVLRKEDVKDILRGERNKALHIFAEAGADLILGGHIHLPYVMPFNRRHPADQTFPWIIQAGTAVSKRVRWNVENSVNVLRYHGSVRRMCTVERWDYSQEIKKFYCMTQTELVLAR